MALREQLNNAIKQAMRDKDRDVLQTLRMLSAALKQIEVDQRLEISDEVVTHEFVRQVKQRRDAAKQYRDAARPELAEREEAEIAIIQRFLPRQLTDAEMQSAVDQVLVETELPREIRSMGALMAQLKAELEGRADMGKVSQYLRTQLQ